jgi:hypothetical protein
VKPVLKGFIDEDVTLSGLGAVVPNRYTEEGLSLKRAL